MTVEYHINSRDALITVTFKGSVSSTEACVTLDDMLNDADFDPTLPQLVDLRSADVSGSEQELKSFETFLLGDYRHRLAASVAIVVNEGWDEATCAKAFWIACALERAELFDNWNQACKWLITKEFSSPVNLLKNELDVLDDDDPEPARTLD